MKDDPFREFDAALADMDRIIALLSAAASTRPHSGPSTTDGPQPRPVVDPRPDGVFCNACLRARRREVTNSSLRGAVLAAAAVVIGALLIGKW